MLENQIALVTGASRGIGKAIAIELAAGGATVVGTATTGDGAASISEYLVAAGTRGRGMVLDVRNGAQIEALIAEIEKAYGGVSILVNNAGIAQDNLAMRMKESEWDMVIETNLKSVFRVSKAVLRGMMKARTGRIINITSVAVKQPIDGLMLSNAARLGVIGMAKTLSRELAPQGITVNNVCPGNIATDRLISLIEARAQQQGISLEQAVSREEGQVPMGYLGDPDDVANLIAFLASAQARYITGTTIQVDGGSTTAVF